MGNCNQAEEEIGSIREVQKTAQNDSNKRGYFKDEFFYVVDNGQIEAQQAATQQNKVEDTESNRAQALSTQELEKHAEKYRFNSHGDIKYILFT